MKKNLTKIFTLMLALALAFSAFAISPLTVNATEGDIKVYDSYSYDDFAALIGGQTAPVKTGYLFAGWYKDASDTDAIRTSSDVTEGTGVYAKFIRADMSRICVQLTLGGSADKTMRLVSIVDSVRYQSIGFKIYRRSCINGEERLLIDKSIEKVYSKLRKYNDDGSEYEDKTPAEVFGSDAEGYKFTTFKVSGIKEAHYQSLVIAKPYWVTLDGTKVDGLGEFNSVDSYINEIVNISINTKQAADIAAGMLTVNYDSTKFEYVGADYGRVFGEMSFSDGGNGTVKCVGVVSDASTNSANPNDVFVNLKFRIKDGVTLTQGDSAFTSTIAPNDFCDINEVFKDSSSISVPTIKF